jgi:hypothetical protein
MILQDLQYAAGASAAPVHDRDDRDDAWPGIGANTAMFSY